MTETVQTAIAVMLGPVLIALIGAYVTLRQAKIAAIKEAAKTAAAVVAPLVKTVEKVAVAVSEVTTVVGEVATAVGEVHHAVNGASLASDEKIADLSRHIADMTPHNPQKEAAAVEAKTTFEDHAVRVAANDIVQAKAIVDAQAAKDEKKE